MTGTGRGELALGMKGYGKAVYFAHKTICRDQALGETANYHLKGIKRLMSASSRGQMSYSSDEVARGFPLNQKQGSWAKYCSIITVRRALQQKVLDGIRCSKLCIELPAIPNMMKSPASCQPSQHLISYVMAIFPSFVAMHNIKKMLENENRSGYYYKVFDPAKIRRTWYKLRPARRKKLQFHRRIATHSQQQE